MTAGNVLHLIDTAGFYGAEKVVITLLKSMKSTDYAGILGCIREKDNERPAIAEEARRYNIPVVYFTMARGLNPCGLRIILHFVKENRIDLVHSHGYKPNIMLGSLFKRTFKIVATVHGWANRSTTARGKTYEFLDAMALKRFDSVVAVSRGVIESLKIRRVDGRKIQLIYNGLEKRCVANNYRTQELRKHYGLPDDAIVIGAVGRLAKVKGQSYLVDAMPYVLEHIENCYLLIAGDGPAVDELDERIGTYNLGERIKLIGYERNIDQFLAAIDLFVMPSLSEGLPISLLEAMAAGKPVIASAVGGIPEVIDGDSSGMLVPAADSHALGNAIVELLRNREIMLQMAEINKTIVSNKFSSDAMMAQYAGLYRKLLS